MKTLKRTALPEIVEYNGDTYKYMSALERVGYSAEQAGEKVICISVSSKKRDENRALANGKRSTRLRFDKESNLSPDKYYFVSDLKGDIKKYSL